MHHPGFYALLERRFVIVSVPETIKQKKPSVFGSVEIRSLHGRYYCYVVSYQRPPNGGPSKKITGQCVGQITESEGFVPNANGLRILAAMPDMYSIYTYGAYEALSILSAQMEDLIRRLYSSAFPSLKTYSLIDVVNGVSSPPLVDYYYRNSFLSIQYPGLIFSATSVDQIRSFKMPSDGRPVAADIRGNLPMPHPCLPYLLVSSSPAIRPPMFALVGQRL